MVITWNFPPFPTKIRAGQLYLARSPMVIEESIVKAVESQPGQGACFTFCLPLAGTNPW
ncbi:MAG TPA: hypothetical protein VFA09_18095 [Ktedonobacteraceae bacterium]|jgi:hypothetical protein|nr:hypothetical protein [Ktedonobacteraceae bacterium]